MRPRTELLHALSQLYLRNAGHVSAGGPALWVNPPADLPWAELLQPERGDALFCQDFSTWRQLKQAGASPLFGDFPDARATWQAIILSVPREKERLDMMLHCCTGLLMDGGSLWLAGENQAGGKSAAGRAKSFFAQVSKADSARHCTLLRAMAPLGSATFDAQDFARPWTLPAGNSLPALTVCSWPGVFAHGHLDDGTRLLLENLPALTSGQRILDFGCGAGVIGARLLQREAGLHVVMADSNALALRAARATLAANHLQAEVLASDGFSELEGRFDLIISNPPFHVGHRSVATLSPGLLQPVRDYLAPGGELVLVANRHLPYQRWLNETFGEYEVRAIHNGFHVLACRRR